jgi:hypothetical protein
MEAPVTAALLESVIVPPRPLLIKMKVYGKTSDSWWMQPSSTHQGLAVRSNSAKYSGVVHTLRIAFDFVGGQIDG